MKYGPFARHKLLSSISFTNMILVILSTALIKQHAALDVLYGILLSGFCCVIVYVVIPRFQFSTGIYEREAAAGKE